MKNLKEMAHLVQDINLKQADFILKEKKQTKSDVFFEKIISGKFRNDNDAAEFFYGTNSTDSRYKNLKHSLRLKLINTLFFIDPRKAHSDYERAYLYCYKNIFVAKIILFLQVKNASLVIFKKVHLKAMEYELTDIIIQTSKILRLHYATRESDMQKFDYYNDIMKNHIEIWEAENAVEEFYARIIIRYMNRKSIDSESIAMGESFYQQISPLLEKHSSPYLHFLGNYIKIIHLMNNNDYIKSIEECEKVIAFFEAKPYTYKTPLRVFLHSQLICYTQLKDYMKGKEVALKSNALVRVGTYNWIINNELHFVLAMHSKEYGEAMKILQGVMKNHFFKTFPAAVKERWLIFEAYISFLVFLGKVNVEAKDRKFRLGKFLNSIPIFSKDKKGSNIPILIIQILFMIVKKDYNQSIDRFEAIEKYCSRYLRRDENFRSNCFIKMLLKVLDADFHKIAVERKAKKYLAQLRSVPLQIAKQAYEIEIILYEDLWEIIMDSLESKMQNVRK